ncbi:splicing factor 3B subunit 1-like [Dorcoceras hygrometricum]|uniref:Splicing factor 3B subunit 1-like n=1 Tax=Dorcoceras hygrometricum TaxID=472368 RepID=A0A2Z7CZB3_9LAMI|nr:splicing factor 3B subunit 1-like [Dorcoceras hygrometricum]
MASSLIANALQVNFDSVLSIPDNDGMVKMFRALEYTGLRGFLGCPSVLYEKELEQFFDTALVKDNEIFCVIHQVPKNLVFDARSLFSKSGEPVKPSCKKREVKYEFRLLNDILAKSVTVKAGSFDAEMADKTFKRAKGYAAQICVLLKGDPAVTLEESKTFPPLKIISAKTVGTYVATNKTIDARGESDEPDVAKVAVVKRKSVPKKRSASTANKDTDEMLRRRGPTANKDTDEVQVEIVAEKAVSKKRPAAASTALDVKKKRTTMGRAAPTEKDLALVTVAQDAVPIQIIEPILAVPAEHVEHGVENQKEKTTVDYVDKIIDQVLTATAQKETDLAEPMVTRSDDTVVKITTHSSAVNDEDVNLDGPENEISRTMASVIAPKQFLKEPLRFGEDDDISEVEQPSRDNNADSVITDQVVQMEEDQRPDSTASDNFSQRIPDIALQSPNLSTSTDSRMLFTTADIPLNDKKVVDHIVLPATALPAPVLAESLAQLRTSVTQISIKHHWKSQCQTGSTASETALSLEMIEFKKGVRAHSAIGTTDLSDIRKEPSSIGAVMIKRGKWVAAEVSRRDDRSRSGGGRGSRSEPVKRRGSGS